MMASGIYPLSVSFRRRVVSILLAVAIFAFLTWLVARADGRPAEVGVSNALLIGLGVGVFEEFYVQSLRGRWLRSMHPLASVLIYAGVVTAIYLVATHVSHLVLGRLDDLPTTYRRLPILIPLFIALSIVGILVMRVVHFVGIETLFHLMVGSYHRPVLQNMVLAFVDMDGSTAIAERLGPLETRSLVGKFLFDVSRPIVDHGGEIYLYKGDGLIALWSWSKAVGGNAVLRAVDAMFAAVSREAAEYRRRFGIVPAFRVGIHGGWVVVSEQGDTKRSIGIYGDTINLAARMEDAAKSHGVACVISETVAEALDRRTERLLPIGTQPIEGLSVPMEILEYRPGADSLRPSTRRPSAAAQDEGIVVGANKKTPLILSRPRSGRVEGRRVSMQQSLISLLPRISPPRRL
jgi:adenylate cyclase